MAIMDDSLDPYFYFHFLVIYDLEVLISFTLFEAEFSTITNVVPSKATPNVWGIIRDFEIHYC